MSNQHKFCIVGAGMSGIVMGIRLKQAGFDDFVIYEKAASLGGTWRENTYPGVACDVPAYYYSYSFAHKADWSRKFAPGAEIREYFEDVARKFEIESHIQYNSEVENASFDGKQWNVLLKNGQADNFDVLLCATGILHRAKIPNIKGSDSFKGKLFHSSQWNHDIDLSDKRVAVIGSGSTGIQMVGPLSRQVKELHLFQRSPQWIMPAPDKVYSNREKLFRRIIPGWARFQYAYTKKIFEAFTDLVLNDGWQRKVVRTYTEKNLARVKDDALREKLTPDYPHACKRLVMSNNFYPAVQNDHVHMITEGIDQITENGILTKDGAVHELDVIVLSTGFDAHAFMRPMSMQNENGLTIDKAWEKTIEAYHTTCVPEFPNFFMVLGPNSPVGNFSVIAAAELQTNYILQCIKKKVAGGFDSVVISKEATSAYNETIREAMKSTIWVSGCTSWYQDASGNFITWPWTPKKFSNDLKKPILKDFVFANKVAAESSDTKQAETAS